VARVHKVAQGAALMTETQVEMRIISAVSNILFNTPLEEALHGIMQELARRISTTPTRKFAAKIQSTLSDKDIASVFITRSAWTPPRPLADFLVPMDAKRNPQIGSTTSAT